MNRQYRRYNRNQPINQSHRSNTLPASQLVNNTSQNHDASRENHNGHNNSHQTPPENKKWQHADTIAALALIVGIIMAIVTYNLFELSEKQAQSVIDGGTAAKESARIARVTLDSSISYQKQFAISQILINRKTDSLDSIKSKHDEAVFNVQMATFQGHQKEFDIENKPFLQISRISIDYPEMGKDQRVNFVFYNAGKQPLQFVTGKLNLGYSTNLNDKDFRFTKPDSIENRIITSMSFVEASVNSQVTITNQTQYNWATNGFFKTFLRGVYVYRNTYNNKRYKYIFDYRISKTSKDAETSTVAIIDSTISLR
jgi:hypothetical protein